MKKLYTALLSLLLVFMLSVGVYALLDKDATFSKSENRALKSRPRITLSSLIDGSYNTEFSEYFSDTFPRREALLERNRSLNGFYYFSGLTSNKGPSIAIDVNTNAADGGESLQVPPDDTQDPDDTQTSAGSENPTTGVPDPTEPEATQAPEKEEPEEEPVVESLGTVLLVGNRAIEAPSANYDKIEEYAAAVSAIAAAMPQGTRTFNIAVPNAAEFYAPEEYHTGKRSQKGMIDFCYAKLDDAVISVDAYSKIASHTDEYLYFRTDHHWTQLGAYYAYTAFCEAAGWKAESLDRFEAGQYDNFVGSMYTYIKDYPQSQILVDEPDTLHYYRPFVDTSTRYYSDTTLSDPVKMGVISGIRDSVSNKYLCFLGGDHPITIIETSAKGPVCMLLKESYGNAFAPWLTSHYSKVIVIDPREFNRSGKPSLDLAAFAKEQGVNDCIVLNYPIMLSSKAYVDWLGRLVQ